MLQNPASATAHGMGDVVGNDSVGTIVGLDVVGFEVGGKVMVQQASSQFVLKSPSQSPGVKPRQNASLALFEKYCESHAVGDVVGAVVGAVVGNEVGDAESATH
jgi:hypothetical protein